MNKQARITNYFEEKLQYNKGKEYSLGAWRKKVIDRDNNQCQHCHNQIKDPLKRAVQNEAHHIIARTHGGKNTLSNGITLCRVCHDYIDLMNFKTKQDYVQLTKGKSTQQKINLVNTFLKDRLLNSLKYER